MGAYCFVIEAFMVVMHLNSMPQLLQHVSLFFFFFTFLAIHAFKNALLDLICRHIVACTWLRKHHPLIILNDRTCT